MAFESLNWGRISSGANANTITKYSYRSATDALATVIANDYFLEKAIEVQVSDTIYVQATDGAGEYRVTALSPNVTLAALYTVAP